MLTNLPKGVNKAVCPISNLLIIQPDNWKDVELAKICKGSYMLIGGHILLSKPVGFADLDATKASMDFINHIIEEHIKEKNFVIIQEYSGIIGYSEEAREYYLKHKTVLKNLLGVIYCGTSPLLKLGIKLGQRKLNDIKVYIVNDYREAINLAVPILSSSSVELIRDMDDENVYNIFNINASKQRDIYVNEYSKKVLELLGNINWEQPGIDKTLIAKVDDALRPILQAIHVIKYDLDNLIDNQKKINLALNKQKTLYQKIFNNISDLLYIHDLNGRITFINKAWERLGYGEKDMGELTIWKLVPSDFHKQVQDNLKKMQFENEQNGLIRILSKDGTSYLFEYRAVITFDSEANERLVYGCAREITKKK